LKAVPAGLKKAQFSLRLATIIWMRDTSGMDVPREYACV